MTTPKLPLEVLQKLFRTTHHIHRQFEMGLAALDIPAYLTGPRVHFLVAVSEAGKIRMSEMAVKMGIQSRTVTQFVDALEKENLIVRLPDPDDRRATLLQITDIAPPLIERAREAMAKVAEQVLEPLPEEMGGQLIDILNHLSSNKNSSTIDDMEH